MIRTPQLAVLLVALAGLPTAGAPVAQAASVNSLNLRATYDVEARFNWSTSRTVTVRSVANVHNPTGSSVSTIAFNLGILRYGGAQVGLVKVNGAPVSETIQDQTVLVPLSLPAGGDRQVEINFTATLQTRTDGDRWQFARLGGHMTAYRWIPWLSRTVKYDRPSVGEVWVTPNSSSVQVQITSDQVLKFATSGRCTGGCSTSLTQTFVANNVRDFNFSAAPDYQITSRTANDGTTIRFFHKSLNADRVLDWAKLAFDTYTNNVGSYPYDQLNISEVGPWWDIESPSLFWLSNDLSSKYLPWTVAHETAHQWFYSVVGNDQAIEPFADEAVADFMARKLVGLWATSQCEKSRLDITVYTKPGSCYPWIVYVQGNRYLKAYFKQVGAAKFWQGLHDYYVDYKFRIGGTRQILDALDNASNYHPNHEARFPTLYP